jgi:hypothetical protein
MTRKRRSLLHALAFAAALSVPAFAEERPASFGVQGSWSDADFAVSSNNGVGVRLAFSLDKHVRNVEIVGSFDYFFPQPDHTYDDIIMYLGYTELNLNAVYKLRRASSSIRPYLGAGLNLARVRGGVGYDPEELGSFGYDAQIRAGMNVLAGVLFRSRLFVEGRNEFEGGKSFVVTAGIRF